MLKELHRRLRPMGFADILDEAIELYKRNFVLLAGIGAVLFVPLAVLQLLIQDPSADSAMRTGKDFGLYMTRTMVVVVVYWIGATFVTAALTFATSENYLGRKTTVLDCYRRVAKPKVIFSFVWANVLYVLAAGGALIVLSFLIGLFAAAVIGFDSKGPALAIIGGTLLVLLGLGALAISVYVGSRLAVYTPAFFVESKSGYESLRRSWDLLKGRVLNTFGLLTVVSLVVFMIKSIILSPLFLTTIRASMSQTDPNPIIVGIYTFISSALDAVMMPITSMVAILIYYDARIRREGFDLEMLAADMGASIERVVEQGPPPLPEESLQTGVPNPEPPKTEEQA